MSKLDYSPECWLTLSNHLKKFREKMEGRKLKEEEGILLQSTFTLKIATTWQKFQAIGLPYDNRLAIYTIALANYLKSFFSLPLQFYIYNWFIQFYWSFYGFVFWEKAYWYIEYWVCMHNVNQIYVSERVESSMHLMFAFWTTQWILPPLIEIQKIQNFM